MDILSTTTGTSETLTPEQSASAGATVSPSSSRDVADVTERPTPTRRSTRTRRTDVQASPMTGTPLAPLVRPDGTPAPVVHLAPELSPYARTGGLGEAVASLAKLPGGVGDPRDDDPAAVRR